MAVVDAGGRQARWSILSKMLRCECWDCRAARGALLRRALRLAATLALAAALGHALHTGLGVARAPGTSGSAQDSRSGSRLSCPSAPA